MWWTWIKASIDGDDRDYDGDDDGYGNDYDDVELKVKLYSLKDTKGNPLNMILTARHATIVYNI